MKPSIVFVLTWLLDIAYHYGVRNFYHNEEGSVKAVILGLALLPFSFTLWLVWQKKYPKMADSFGAFFAAAACYKLTLDIILYTLYGRL